MKDESKAERVCYLAVACGHLGLDVDDTANELRDDGVAVMGPPYDPFIMEGDMWAWLATVDLGGVRDPELRTDLGAHQRKAARVLAGDPKAFMAMLNLAAEAGIPMGGASR